MTPESPLVLPSLNLAELERVAIKAALSKCGGVRRRACKELGIDVRTLQRKIKLMGISGENHVPQQR